MSSQLTLVGRPCQRLVDNGGNALFLLLKAGPLLLQIIKSSLARYWEIDMRAFAVLFVFPLVTRSFLLF